MFDSRFPLVAFSSRSLPDFVLGHTPCRVDRLAIVDGPSGRGLTFGELRRDVAAVAGGLIGRGLAAGQVVAICAPNVPDFAVVYHGILAAGGVVTMANPLITVNELAFQLSDSRARYLITVPPLAERAAEAAWRAGVQEVFVIGPGHVRGTTPFGALLAGGGRPVDVEIDIDALAALPYSSGTTGMPKGVMLTHRTMVGNIQQALSMHRVTSADVLIAALPLYHIYGQQIIMNLGLSQGAMVVTMPRFDLEQFLGIIQDYRVTRAYVVPPILLGLAKHPMVDRFDLSSLKVVVSGAAPLGAELQLAAAKRLGCRVVQGYGLTETGPVTHAVPDDGEVVPGSVGPLVPNTQMKIVDVVTGRELSVRQTGEICVRGPQVMQGYFNNPSATRRTIDADGFLHTGDIGYVDEHGYLHIVDRLKELIRHRGFQVSPAELEALLLTHPGIADAGVVGVRDDAVGEYPKAFVVPRGELDPAEVLGFVARRVAPYKRIAEVEFITEIPRASSGKILRRVLADRAYR